LWTFTHIIEKNIFQLSLSDSPVDKDVCVLVANFLCLTDLTIVEDVILVVSSADGPIVAALCGSLMDNHTQKLILFAAKLLELFVFNRFGVFDFLVVLCLESVQVDDQDLREFLDS